ncbi:LOW QUALITY PROTEIN: probable glutamate receptor [Panulirus ornatus]|uniref:LOW QUALITY PROTEIN: probable glutamate receptor n=1 Tax=Panulirus ornatus TaxID=150431 RepID=UPI003A843B56
MHHTTVIELMNQSRGKGVQFTGDGECGSSVVHPVCGCPPVCRPAASRPYMVSPQMASFHTPYVASYLSASYPGFMIVHMHGCLFTRRLSPIYLACGEETLGMAGGAVEAVLARERPPHCSVILLTDGTTSATTVFTELDRLRIPLGLAVFEVAGEDKSPNMTQTQLSWMVGEARRLRQVSGCVTLVVVSDDPAFLAASAEWSLKGRLLTWSNKLLAVTRQPYQDLPHLYTSFSMMNAMLLIMDTSAGLSRCSIYVHLPYTPQESKVVLLASWSTLRGLILATHLPLFPEKFSRFAHEPSFVAVAEEYPSYVEIDPASTPGQPLNFRGPVIQLLALLADNFNFTYTFVRPPDGKWGTKEADGSWSGMVGMVGRKEVDMGVGPFSLSGVRAEMVDYMKLVVDDALKIIGGLGRPEVDPWGFLLPLGPLVWTAILAALLVVPGMVLLLLFCFPRKAPQRDTWKMDNIFSYVRILLQQGYKPVAGEWGWERLVLGSWMVMALVFIRSYDGNLMSMLAVRYIPQPYQSLRDVLDDPSATTIWAAGTNYIQYLRTVKTGTFGEVMDTMKEGRLMLVTTTQYRQVLETLVAEGRHVLIVEENEGRSLRADVFSDTGRCDFYTSRERFLPSSMGMIGQKDHPLVPALSKSIKFVKQFGIFDYWMRSFKVNSTVCLHPPTRITIKSSLAVSNLWGMFVVLAGGHAVALLLLCVELLAARLVQTQSH